jgi:5-hydroxyisourate hydrolase-like protein (transthyretin family)
VSGVLTTSPASGVTVALWREQAGQSSFHQVATTTTDSSGHYTFALKRGTVMADQAWYATADSLRSATIDQQVRALVALVSSSHTPAAGDAIALHGNVSPSHAGAVVLIEQRRGSTWRVIARPRLSKGSSYSISHRFAHAGKAELRAVLARSARNLASTSPTVSLTVQS